jgi:hypothetical protein
MITSKQTRCARYVWGYITKYPHVSARSIASAQTDYMYEEVVEAIARLEASGLIARGRESCGGHYQWHAVIPFVVSIPEWAI